MLATLSSYEDLFGSCHPLTLRMLTELGFALWHRRRTEDALRLLQRGLRDTTRVLGRNHELRLRLLSALRELFTELNECGEATATQKELLECHAELFGTEHPKTFAAREMLARMLLRNPHTEQNAKAE